MSDLFRKTLRKFFEKSMTLCLSTCDEKGQPHSSLIYFALAEEDTLYFFSKKETQKSKNIEKNPKVALLLQDPENQNSLQMQGRAEEIKNVQERENAFDFLMRTLSGKIDWPPPAGKIDAGELVLYKIKVTWARLGHFKDHDHDIFTQLIP